MTEQNWQEIAKIFEDAQKQVEAVLKPKAECWNEPWNNCGGSGLRDCTGRYINYCIDSPRRERVIECVNAMAGVKDPAAFVAAARELAERCKNHDWPHRDIAERLDWLAANKRLAEAVAP